MMARGKDLDEVKADAIGGCIRHRAGTYTITPYSLVHGICKNPTAGDVSVEGGVMTREEVKAMTDEQLRIKAAELAGWIKLDEPEVIAGWLMHGTIDCWWKNGKRLMEDAPDYPNDRKAVWELVDFACDKHGLGFMIERCSGETEWFASFYRNDDECWTACDTDESDTKATVRSFILAMAS